MSCAYSQYYSTIVYYRGCLSTIFTPCDEMYSKGLSSFPIRGICISYHINCPRMFCDNVKVTRGVTSIEAEEAVASSLFADVMNIN